MIFLGWRWLDWVSAVPRGVSVYKSEGGAFVNLWVGDQQDGLVHLEPEDARAIAERLIEVADDVDLEVGDDGDLGGWPEQSES